MEQNNENLNQNPYASKEPDLDQNPYASKEPEFNENGKKLSVGMGIASMILGIISLLCFCSGVNIITATIAIIFGIIQIVTCEKKGMAIAGIATAVVSIFLCVACYTIIFTNTAFMRMMEHEMMEEFNQDDVREFLEHYDVDADDML